MFVQINRWPPFFGREVGHPEILDVFSLGVSYMIQSTPVLSLGVSRDDAGIFR